MVATGIIRAETEARLVEQIGGLDGFSTDLIDDGWMVTPPVKGRPKNRRWVVIGAPEGVFDPEGMQSGKGPGVDAWGIACGIAAAGYTDALEGKQAVQDALNAIADLLAADGRLGMANGPRDLTVTTIDGPYHEWTENVPLAWLNFDVQCFADIRRNP